MQVPERFALVIKILLPILFLIAIGANPASNAVRKELEQARFAEENSRPDAAARFLRNVAALEPWRKNLWERIGEAEYQAGNPAGAAQAFESARLNHLLSNEGLFLLGEAYYQQEQFASAEEAWQSLANKHDLPPDLANRMYDRLASLQRANGDIQGAIKTLTRWRQAAPENPEAAFTLGLLLSVVEPDRALPLLIEASSQDPAFTAEVQKIRRGIGQAGEEDDPGYQWLVIGRALGNAGHWDLAEIAFQKSVDARPEYAEAWAFLAEAKYQVGKNGTADLEHAQGLDPRSVIVRAIQAVQYRRSGNYEQAAALLESVAKEEPDEPLWQVELGNTLAEQGDLPAAYIHFQNAAEIAPGISQYWQYLAWFSVQYNFDVPAVGLPAARQAVILAPEDPSALDTMGWTLLSLEDYASAERFLQQALEKDPGYPLALLHLGQLYLQWQERDNAYPYLKQASELGGEDIVGRTAKRLIEQYY